MTKTHNWIGDIITGLIWIVVGILLDFAIQVAGMYSARSMASLLHVSPNSAGPIMTMVLFLAVFTTIAVLVVGYGVRQRSPKLGLHKFNAHKANWIWRGYLMIIGAGILTVFLQYIFAGGFQTATNQQALEKMASTGGTNLVFVILLAVEELIFRGIVLNYFFKDGPWWLNVVISGVLFGYFHVFQDFQIFALIQYSLMGIALAVVYKKTKQIQYSMMTHMLNNAIASLSLISMAFH